MDRYFTVIKAVLERHGGIVEKYIGDAVMAVFGLLRAHEDDALRAVRAAWEMKTELSNLNTELKGHWGVVLSNRTGVNTGEVVVGDAASGQRLATGDVVNVAARLEQAAPVGQVLIGSTTYRLIRDAVEVEAVEPLVLKGKSQAMPAFQVMDVTRGVLGVARRLDAAMVGREDELSIIVEAFEETLAKRSCHLITVFGDAGVGKSRLVAEVVDRLRARARVLRGRCLSYGEGITFWPLAGIVKDAADIGDDDSSVNARSKIGTVLIGEEEATAISERLASVMGLASSSFPIEETFWASRRTLESLARREPLLVVLEDIHWAEATFLDLIEHVVEHSKDSSMLIVCPARRELLEERPEWMQGRANATTISLGSLSADESEFLIGDLLPGLSAAVRSRITGSAQGNPLFVEQIISMWMEDGTLSREDDQWHFRADAATLTVPPTISALLSARLDRLLQEERMVIAAAAVVGQVFHRGAVQELSSPTFARQVPVSLATLLSKQFIRPEPSALADEESYAFRHVLVRDAAYKAMLKRTRAELHERFAIWLERVTGDRIGEYEEIVGYHLEQAYCYRETLGPVDERGRQLAEQAAQWLSSAGHRAFGRDDMPAAINLFGRAQELLGQEETLTLAFVGDFATAHGEIGNFAKAHALFNHAIELASASGDHRAAAHAAIDRLLMRFERSDTVPSAEARGQAEELIATLESVGDDLGVAKAWRLVAQSFLSEIHLLSAAAAFQEAIRHAAAAGNNREEMENLAWLAFTHVLGPSPAQDALLFCNEVASRASDSRKIQAYMLDASSRLEAMQGHFSEARKMIKKARELYDDLGLMGSSILAQAAGFVEMQADDAIAAETELRSGCDKLMELEEHSALATVAAQLANALYAQKRYDEAQQFIELSERVSSVSDSEAQAVRRGCAAKILARQGNVREAERIARSAVRDVGESDSLTTHADILMDLGEILSVGRRQDEAFSPVQQALQLYEQKGNIVSAGKARKMLQDLKHNRVVRLPSHT
jgi:tetratricopeptide (TPR) repeat protein